MSKNSAMWLSFHEWMTAATINQHDNEQLSLPSHQSWGRNSSVYIYTQYIVHATNIYTVCQVISGHSGTKRAVFVGTTSTLLTCQFFATSDLFLKVFLVFRHASSARGRRGGGGSRTVIYKFRLQLHYIYLVVGSLGLAGPCAKFYAMNQSNTGQIPYF